MQAKQILLGLGPKFTPPHFTHASEGGGVQGNDPGLNDEKSKAGVSGDVEGRGAGCGSVTNCN